MSTTTFDYRNHDATVTHRLELRRRRIDEGLSTPRARAAARLFRHRFARSTGAVGGLLGLSVTIFYAAIGAIGTGHDETGTAELFFFSLGVVPLAYIVGRLIAPWFERRALRRAREHDPDPVVALEALRYATGETIAAQVARKWELASLSLPLIATALIAPLTLHAPLFLGATRPAHEFGEWILLSAVIVGHAHLVFAYLAHRHVRHLTSGAPIPTHAATRTWALTVLTAAVPGILLVGIPPIITGVTGLFLVAPMFYWARNTMLRERALLV